MPPFWESKTLSQMNDSEWELLCDGCAKCCLVKLEDRDTGEIFHTNVTCKLLDINTCECSQYQQRHSIVNDCISLNKKNIETLSWLPETCAYRLIADGEKLPDWHHLVCGDKQVVHSYGASLQGWVVSELDVREEDVEDHVIQWVD
ncbi:MAG: YcgN family cysteine cluster protein [Porticoccaceae bacterium]|nr:YcgN family cysteine cluster protein [Porticoccaceae bacterium]